MADDEYDLWDTLHLQPGATLDEVRVAFRELSRVYHPDKRNGARTERAEGENAAFVRVHRAYRILSDEALRGFYEKYGLSGVRLAESLSDEEGAEGAVSLIDDRLKVATEEHDVISLGYEVNILEDLECSHEKR
ncbi:unnamed protein product [Cladocopium goreaui]|uniref:Chaperone protein dnaJ 13 (AtDjB13) (AtJ13) n=1 Tax=Cladocopium goreaui TaxID=2562237 RepID=A0A9P1FV70_9DINO|nr:unnamed protein product [Cladocopium goreaui]